MMGRGMYSVNVVINVGHGGFAEVCVMGIG